MGLLHLTDLHVGLDGQSWLLPQVLHQVERDLERLCERAGPIDMVLFTGDLTQQGTPAEFERLDGVLDRLLDHLRALGSDPVLLAVPGNHDLVRPPEDDDAAIALRGWAANPKLRDRFWKDAGSSWRATVARAFAPWSAWWERRRGRQRELLRYEPGLLPGEFSATVEVRGRHLGVAGLNTAFLHLWSGDVSGALTLHPRQLAAPCQDDPDAWAAAHDACLLLTHHPRSWLDKDGAQNLRGEIYLAERFVAHLTGHVHEQGATEEALDGGPLRRELPGASLFGLERWWDWKSGDEQVERVHGYAALRLEFHPESRRLRLWPRLAARRMGGGWRIDKHTGFETLDDEGTAPRELGPSPRRPPRPPRLPSLTPPDEPPPETTEESEEAPEIALLHLLMDRSAQWDALRARLREPQGHFVASVFGSVEQDLELFCERVRLFINERGPIEHHVLQVDLRGRGNYAMTAVEVGNRVMHACGRASGGLPAALHAAARAKPLLLLVLRDHGPVRGLVPEEMDALCAFLSDLLPAALKRAEPAHPVRVLLPAQHSSDEGYALDDDLCETLTMALDRGAWAGVEHVRLLELTIPTWSEVEQQLRETFRVRDRAHLAACRDAYRASRQQPDASYASLAQAIMLAWHTSARSKDEA